MDEYKVGQILFLIGEKTTKIIPVQIIEEVVRTTVDGKQKTYTVLLPDKKATKVDIREVKGELFKDWQSLRTKMLNNASKAIDEMVSRAINLSENVFETYIEEEVETIDSTDFDMSIPDMPEVQPDEDVQKVKKNDIIKVDLGNGQVATMSTDSLNKIGA
jgi:hypothetical protein